MPFGFLKRKTKKQDDRAAPVEATPSGVQQPAGPIRIYSMGPSQEMRYAVELLTGKGLAFEEVDISSDASLQSWVKTKTGSGEYPQVFLGSKPLGAFETVRRLDFEGNLDRVLKGLPPIVPKTQEDDFAEASEFDRVRARLRRGDVLSLTTGDGETFDTWAEVFANPPLVYYRGEPRPIEDLDTIVGEVVEHLLDDRAEVEWSQGG